MVIFFASIEAGVLPSSSAFSFSATSQLVTLRLCLISCSVLGCLPVTQQAHWHFLNRRCWSSGSLANSFALVFLHVFEWRFQRVSMGFSRPNPTRFWNAYGTDQHLNG